MEKISHFLALNVNIMKTVADTVKVTVLLMINRKLHIRFRLAPRSMTLYGLELLYVRIIFGEFRGISQIWQARTAKQMSVKDSVVTH